MRRDVVNALTRVRRDLRFLLADRYRALLASRFVVLTAIAASALDRGAAAVAVVRRLRGGRPTASPATVLRAAVTGGDELSLTLHDPPRGADAVVLRRDGATRTLATVVDRGVELRVLATLSADVCDGADWTVAVRSGDALTDVAVVDASALATRTGRPRRRAARDAAAEPRDDSWPPRLRADGGRLVLRARPPADVGVEHTVAVGVRSAVVTWPASTAGTAGIELVLTAGGSERTIPATIDAGTAHASVDLGSFEAAGTWFAFVASGGERAALQLPRSTFPHLDLTGRPHRVPLPTRGPTGLSAEVGYSSDNQLVIRVGNFAPAAS